MKRISILPLLLLAALIASSLLLAPSARAEDPKVFIELGKGVSHARDGKRLVLFLLVENFAKESESILEAINQELSGKGHEFTIVRCRNESADHRKLFEDRFKQDPDKMPLGVIASPAGEVVIGTNGKSPDAYRIMIQAGRIQAGFETDPDKIAALRNAIENDEDAANSVFGLKRSDIEVTRHLITEYRDWKFANGTTLKAALLEAKGATGVFITMEGKERELDFNSLSDADKGYLSIILSSQ
tara:strand:- start:6296 stop:7024 length:729 start_codon:yes stop_codon:yes gene_type:complete